MLTHRKLRWSERGIRLEIMGSDHASAVVHLTTACPARTGVAVMAMVSP